MQLKPVEGKEELGRIVALNEELVESANEVARRTWTDVDRDWTTLVVVLIY